MSSPESIVTQKREEIKDPEKWLKDTGHFRFEYPNEGETSTLSGEDISEHYKKIESSVPEEDLIFIRGLVDYIKAPMIFDDFFSHAERKFWRKTEAYNHPEVNKIFENNKLKVNMISNVLGTAGLAESSGWLESHPEIIRRYLSLRDLFGNYESMEIEDKISLVFNITYFARNLYQVLTDRFVKESTESKP